MPQQALTVSITIYLTRAFFGCILVVHGLHYTSLIGQAKNVTLSLCCPSFMRQVLPSDSVTFIRSSHPGYMVWETVKIMMSGDILTNVIMNQGHHKSQNKSPSLGSTSIFCFQLFYTSATFLWLLLSNPKI
jgi:hypothetical protein